MGQKNSLEMLINAQHAGSPLINWALMASLVLWTAMSRNGSINTQKDAFGFQFSVNWN